MVTGDQQLERLQQPQLLQNQKNPILDRQNRSKSSNRSINPYLVYLHLLFHNCCLQTLSSIRNFDSMQPREEGAFTQILVAKACIDRFHDHCVCAVTVTGNIWALHLGYPGERLKTSPSLLRIPNNDPSLAF